MKNALVQTTGDTYLHNASYACNAGLQLVGSKTLVCQANGTWSLPAPTCEGMTGACEVFRVNKGRTEWLHIIILDLHVRGQRLRRPQTDAARQSAGAQPEHWARCGLSV